MPPASPFHNDRTRGIAYGLFAAAFFGLSAPLAKWLLTGVGPVLLAGLLYLAGGFALTAIDWLRKARRRPPVEARLGRSDAWPLLGIIVFGGIAGPILMLLGLQRVTGFAGSLLLNLEAPLTMLIAWVFFREHLSRGEAIAALAIVLGAAAFRLDPGPARIDTIGTLLLSAACLCWAIDNNFTQRLSIRDPLAIARVKTLSAGTTNVILGVFLGEGLTTLTLVPAIAAVGAFSYGVSIVLDNIALRKLGAAREAAIFATAPFVGAVASMLLLGDRPRPIDAIGATLMLIGVITLVRAHHSHRHRHDPIEHEHQHTHDEHHEHTHNQHEPAGDLHVHQHRHEPIEHEHEHVSDVHHRHEHKS